MKSIADDTRGQGFSTPSGVYVVIFTALLVFTVGVAVIHGAGMQNEWEENREHFERYCTERFGDDAYVYSGGGQGVHAGLHCEDSDHKPVHLGAIEPTVWESYKNGDATTEDVTESVRPVGFMGRVGGYPWEEFAVTVGLVLGVGVIARSRSD